MTTVSLNSFFDSGLTPLFAIPSPATYLRIDPGL